MSKPNRRFITPTALILVFLVLTAVFFFRQFIDANQVSIFVIETEKIPELRAHPHEPWLDSIEDAGHHKITRSPIVTAPEDMWVKGFEVNVVNGTFHSVHHVFLGRTDKKDAYCPDYPWEALFVTSEVNPDGAYFPGNYAVFLKKGTPLKIVAMLHNATPPLGPGVDYKNVSVQLIMHYQKNTLFSRGIPLTYQRLHLSDTPCMDAEKAETFEVPPNQKAYVKKPATKKEEQTSSYTFPTDSTIVGMAGHFHPFEGGENVEAYLNNRPLYQFEATELPQNNWTYWHIPNYPSFLPVKKNDKLSITSTYTNPNPYPVRGAMGMMIFYFAKE